MATELTYDSLVNVQAPDADEAYAPWTAETQSKWATWFLVKALAGGVGSFAPTASPRGKWTIDYSCDGTTGGTGTQGDLQDRWGTTFTPSKLLHGDTTFSWAVLKSPAGLAGDGLFSYMLISLDRADGSGYVTPNIFFSRAGFTGGTKNARPTATDEYGLPGTSAYGAWSPPYTANYITDQGTSGSNHYCHLVLSTRGDFFFWTSYTGLGSMFSTLMHVRIQDTKAADGYKMLSFYYGQPGLNCGNGDCYGAPVPNTSYVNTGLALGGAYGSMGRGRNYDGSAVVQLCAAVPYIHSVGDPFATAGGPAYSDNESDGTYSEWYVPVFSTYEGNTNFNDSRINGSKPHRELKGRLPDVLVASGTLSSCALRPASPSPTYDYIKVGQFWFPWPVAVTPQV